jgi:hypothetical protein
MILEAPTLSSSEAILELILLARVDIVDVSIQSIRLPDPVPFTSCK